MYASSLLTNRKVTQEEVCEAASVSEVTIRNRYTELRDVVEQ